MTDKIKKRVKYLKEQPDKPYFIKYKVEVGRFGKEDIAQNEGATQDMIVISCITHPDGSYSQTWASRNGEIDGQLHDHDVFKAWILMAASLRDKQDLSPETRQFVDLVFETYRATVLADQGKTQLKRYSVLLRYPDNHNVNGLETYFTAVEAHNAAEAAEQARAEVIANNEFEDDPEDFAVLLVIEGHHKDVRC